MMFGVVLVGTYTSIFIAAPILIYLGVGTHRDAPKSRQSRTSPRRSDDGEPLGRAASSEVGPDRGLRQGGLRLRRDVASRLAVVPSGRDLGLAGDTARGDRRNSLDGCSLRPMASIP